MREIRNVVGVLGGKIPGSGQEPPVKGISECRSLTERCAPGRAM
jgi:hypothetical protein